MDDILVFTETNEQHTAVVREYSRFYATTTYFSNRRNVFITNRVEYLGLIIGNKQARMDPTKVSAIRDWPVPRRNKNYNDSRLLQFLPPLHQRLLENR